MPKPTVTVHTAWLPRKGHSPEEYEDAFATSKPTLPFRAAIADGATESAFSGGWARALVDAYVAAIPERRPAKEPTASAPDHDNAVNPRTLADAVQRARSGWSPPEDARWYVAAKAAEGAHAAVLGLHVDRNAWHAEAVGDCCLFLIRERGLIESWPLADPNDFSHRPHLVSSRSSDVDPEVTGKSGTWMSGDTFVLATDAFAAWLLAQESFPNVNNINHLLDNARGSGMRNDDVTAVVIQP